MTIDLVFDVMVCLLLVSANIGLVVTADASADASLDGDAVVDADGVASSLATSTATVNYSLSPGVGAADPSLLGADDVGARELEQTAHGSLAGLLAHSMLDAVTVDGVRLTRARDDFRKRAVARVASKFPTRGVSVTVSWTPFPGSSVRASDTFGPEPPSSTTVHSATPDVPSGFPAACEDAIAASDDGFGAVARLVTDRTVAGLFPPTFVRFALRGDEPVSTLMAHRYEWAGTLAGTSVAPEVAREETRTANTDLVAALNPRFAKTMCARYDTSRAAVETVSVGRVTTVVRTWSP